MASADIIGHAAQREALLRDVKTKNVAHAYLFEGPKSIGKFTVAKWFAEILLSVDARTPEEEKRVHEQTKRLIHPDFLVVDQLWIEDACEDLDLIARYSNISQHHRSKAHARTDTIGIDDIRMVQERLQEVGNGTYRCCLIRSMERMQDEAVNALLKILEEPPPGVVFLLTTQMMHSLLPTLLSRTRVLPFKRLSPSELRPLLAGIDADDARFILHLAQGAPGRLRRLMADPALLRSEQTVRAQAGSFWQSRSLAERLKLLVPLHERNQDADRFLLHLCLTLREEIERHHPSAGIALEELIQGLESNASRQLLVQRFAMRAVTTRD